MPQANLWTDEEKQYLRKHFESRTKRQIGDALGRSEHAVCQQGLALGLRTGWRGNRTTKYRTLDGCRNVPKQLPEHLRDAFYEFLLLEVVDKSRMDARQEDNHMRDRERSRQPGEMVHAPGTAWRLPPPPDDSQFRNPIASGIITKEEDSIVHQIRAKQAKQAEPKRRIDEVYDCIRAGMSRDAIAEKLGMKPITVYSYARDLHRSARLSECPFTPPNTADKAAAKAKAAEQLAAQPPPAEPQQESAPELVPEPEAVDDVSAVSVAMFDEAVAEAEAVAGMLAKYRAIAATAEAELEDQAGSVISHLWEQARREVGLLCSRGISS